MAGQGARTAVERPGGAGDVAKIKIEGGSNGLVIVVVRSDGKRTQIGRQILDLGQARGDGVWPTDSYGMISWGGLRFWPAETRS